MGYDPAKHSDRQNEQMAKWEANKMTPEQRAEQRAQRVYDDQQFLLASHANERERLDEAFRRIKKVQGDAVSSNGGPDGGPTEGEWYALTLCDGTTLDVWAKNIVPP